MPEPENPECSLTERFDRAAELLDSLFDDISVIRQSMFTLHEALVDLINELEDLEKKANDPGHSR